MLNSLLVVAIVTIIAWLGSAVGMGAFFGIVLPYVAIVVFLAGVVWRMVWWAKSPVPFAIPTTGGQEKSLDFIKQAQWDCPDTTLGVVKRMFLEVFLFRSLFPLPAILQFFLLRILIIQLLHHGLAHICRRGMDCILGHIVQTCLQGI